MVRLHEGKERGVRISVDMQRHHVRWLKGLLLVLWVLLIVGVYGFLHTHDIRIRAIPRFIRTEVLAAGWWGPFVIIGLYFASSFLFFSKAALDVVTGTIYGPWWGSLVVLIGINLASTIVFFLGRYFGRHFVQTHEHGWIRRHDELLKTEGFITVLIMRLFLFPFDPVSLGCGMSAMTFRAFAWATFFGSLPGTVTFVVLGDAIAEPEGWFLFGILFLISLGLALWLQRSRLGKRLLSKKEPPV